MTHGRYREDVVVPPPTPSGPLSPSLMKLCPVLHRPARLHVEPRASLRVSLTLALAMALLQQVKSISKVCWLCRNDWD